MIINSVFYGFKLAFKGVPVGKIVSARVAGVENNNICKSNNGSYIVDHDTETSIMYGNDACDFLDKNSFFNNKTEVIAQSHTKLKVSCEDGEYILDEPGAVLIDKNKICKVQVLEGNPLVVQYQNSPFWYKQLQPNNEHQDTFAFLAKRNHEIYNCDNHPKISSFQNEGEVQESDFSYCPNWVYSKLYQTGMLKANLDGKYVWAGFWDNNNFQKDLYEKTGIYGNLKDIILNIWQKTTKSGYDISGLKKVFSGITIYTHKDKFNQHNNASTEWITNSTAWTDSGPFSIGVSRVFNEDEKIAREFNKIRPSEQFHKHQNPNNFSQNTKEVYLLTQGNAILCTIEGNKTKYNELKAGDVFVIPHNVFHGITAISGEYEHLCTQTPSTFQYGFALKNIFRSFLSGEKEEAVSKLSNQTRTQNDIAYKSTNIFWEILKEIVLNVY